MKDFFCRVHDVVLFLCGALVAGYNYFLVDACVAGYNNIFLCGALVAG
jgi:hypothetical protein